MTTDSWPHGDMLLVAATLMEGAGDRGKQKGDLWQVSVCLCNFSLSIKLLQRYMLLINPAFLRALHSHS